jgi:hypothetical protein
MEVPRTHVHVDFCVCEFTLTPVYCHANKQLIISVQITSKSHDSSVGIALDYGLDDRGSRVQFPAGAGNFSLHHRVQNQGLFPWG